jgi:hypothetical protein
MCVQPSLAIFVCLGHQVFCLSLTFGTARAIPAQTHILLIRLWYDIALVGVCVYAFCARPSKLLSLLAARSLSLSVHDAKLKFSISVGVCAGCGAERRDKRPESTRFSHRRLRSHSLISHQVIVTQSRANLTARLHFCKYNGNNNNNIITAVRRASFPFYALFATRSLARTVCVRRAESAGQKNRR